MNDSELRDLARDIAIHLDDFALLDSEPHFIYLVHPDGRKLDVHAQGWSRHPVRVWVEGVYPHCRYPSPEQFHLTAAIRRGGEAIANDIKRKLLPPYGEELEKTRQRIARDTADDARRLARARRLLMLFGGRGRIRNDDRNNRTTVTWYSPGEGCVSGTLDLFGDGSTGSMRMYEEQLATIQRVATAIGMGGHLPAIEGGPERAIEPV